jgi:hypothetical protein
MQLIRLTFNIKMLQRYRIIDNAIKTFLYDLYVD